MSLPTLREVRRLAIERALARDYIGGRLQAEGRDPTDFFGVLRAEAEFAQIAAAEWADPKGPLAGDARLADAALAALETGRKQFQPTGTVGGGDMNSPYFMLVPFTQALLSLRRGGSDARRIDPLIGACIKLFDDAAANIPRLHEYLNPRGLEAVSALGLYRLTDDRRFLDRARLCIEKLLAIQYPCGAQPYHTAGWIWGRKPAQVYQLLTVTMMLHVGRFLKWPEVDAYGRRLMDYELLSTNRRGEAFVTCFEGLHKAGTLEPSGWTWPVAAALGDARYAPLAHSTYELWLGLTGLTAVKTSTVRRRRTPNFMYVQGIANAGLLGVNDVPEAQRFAPVPGVIALPDISTVFVHEPGLDVAMSLLSGYSAFAEADCGDVKLFALTPELTDRPTFSNAGTDAVRLDWTKPTEQIECAASGGRSTLRGRVFTKWDVPGGSKDTSQIHTRQLEVGMTYEDGELVLEYRTIQNKRTEPLPSRLLFLLVARPPGGAPTLRIGDQLFSPPAAESAEPFLVKAPVGVVRFDAPDGSYIEVEPEVSTAKSIVAERPLAAHAAPKEGQAGKLHLVVLKPANEGSLRVAFEGPDALERGRYRIRFVPAS